MNGTLSSSVHSLHARCIYNASAFLPVRAEVLLPPTPAPVSQLGPLQLELRIATGKPSPELGAKTIVFSWRATLLLTLLLCLVSSDASYKSYYSDGDYPVVKLLREPVHVEVRILQRTDPSLVLVLHDCWATPSTNPLEQLQWPILVDG